MDASNCVAYTRTPAHHHRMVLAEQDLIKVQVNFKLG